MVFSCGRPIVMMGLDLTRQALCYPEIVDRMAKIDTKAGKLFVDLMRFFCMTQKRYLDGREARFTIHYHCLSVTQPV